MSVEVQAGQWWVAPTEDGAGEPFHVVRVMKDRAAIFWPRATPGWQHGHKLLSAFAKCRLEPIRSTSTERES